MALTWLTGLRLEALSEDTEPQVSPFLAYDASCGQFDLRFCSSWS